MSLTPTSFVACMITPIASCTATVDTAVDCFIMETEAIMFFTGPIDEDIAAFEAYKAIQGKMLNDRFIGIIPTIVRLQYLSPFPIPVPPGVDGDGSDGEPIPVTTNRSGTSNLSPWTIGASVASIMGGFVSILVWARARRFRQRRQQLMDETSSWVNSGDPISAE